MLTCCLCYFQDPAASSTSEAEPDTKGEAVTMNYKPSPLQVQIGNRAGVTQGLIEGFMIQDLPHCRGIYLLRQAEGFVCYKNKLIFSPLKYG